MPLVRSIGGDVDDIIAALPKGLYCEGYHGGTTDSGWASSSISIVAPFDGEVTCSVSWTRSSGNDGYGHLSVSKNGTTVVSIGSGSQTFSFVEGDTLSFAASANGLGSWARVATSASFTWTAT